MDHKGIPRPPIRCGTEYIFAASIVPSLCFVVIMALVSRFLVHKHGSHTTIVQTTPTDTEQQPQLEHISRSWTSRFTEKPDHNRAHWVPSLTAVIKAGDEALYTSELFTTINEHPEEPRLAHLYRAFASNLRACPNIEPSTYSDKISKFLTRSGHAVARIGRVKSMSRSVSNGSREATRKQHRKSLNLSNTDGGLRRSLSVKRAAPALMSLENRLAEMDGEKSAITTWMNDCQVSEQQGDGILIETTLAELAAMSIVLGSPLDLHGNGYTTHKGAFGISMSMTSNKVVGHQVTLQGHKRSVSQQHARGSGFSILFAKHLAAGFLPFSQSKDAINSILLTDSILGAVQAGASLEIGEASTSTPQSKFLSSLPSSRNLQFNNLTASTEQQSLDTLINAIARLPFVGSLTPLASRPLIKTVQFIASGGLPPGRLLQRLEDLVDKVHNQAPHLDIFGPLYEPQNAGLLYRERKRLGKLANTSTTSDSISEKTARISRYVTLLQRLMALVPDVKPQEVLNTARAATIAELQSSNIESVAAHAKDSASSTRIHHHHNLDANAKWECQPTNSSASASSSDYPSNATKLTADNSNSAPSSTLPLPRNLGQQVESVLKRELPLDVATIAFLARMVIVAWTLSVQTVVWEEGEEGFPVPQLDGFSSDKIVIS